MALHGKAPEGLLVPFTKKGEENFERIFRKKKKTKKKKECSIDCPRRDKADAIPFTMTVGCMSYEGELEYVKADGYDTYYKVAMHFVNGEICAGTAKINMRIQ